jgi:hypothetical protein
MVRHLRMAFPALPFPMTETDTEGDRLAHQRFCLIADKIAADPAVLAIPLENIQRWLGNGHWAKRELTVWKGWIEAAQVDPAALQRLLDLLRDDSEESRDWKGFSPFPGILTKGELKPLVWTSRH